MDLFYIAGSKQKAKISLNKVRYTIDKLLSLKIIKKGNYNKTKYDRTCWYAFENDELLSEIINLITKKEIHKWKCKKSKSCC